MKPSVLLAVHWAFAAVCVCGLAGAYHLYAGNAPRPVEKSQPVDDGPFIKGLSDAELDAEIAAAGDAWRQIAYNATNIDATQPSDNHAAATYRWFAKLRKERDARAKRP